MFRFHFDAAPQIINFAWLNFSASRFGSEMSEYQNVVGGRLKLKGKPLDVKEGGVKKKKKKHRRDP